MKKIVSLIICFAMMIPSIGVYANDSSILKNVSVIETPADSNTTVSYKKVNGENCIYLKNREKTLVLKTDDTAFPDDTENAALRIVYLDNDINFIEVSFSVKRDGGNIKKERLIHKSNSGEMREALILINSGVYTGGEDGFYGGDVLISSYGPNGELCEEFIKEIEIVNLDNIGTNEESGVKKHLLHRSSAYILEKLSLMPEGDLSVKASNDDINLFFEKITGKTGDFTGNTMDELIANWNKKLGATPLRGVTHEPGFFEHRGYELQNFGVARVTYEDGQSIFYDDLAGLLYNVLFMSNSNGVPYMVALAQKDEDFKEKLLGLNDFLISNTYYDSAGIEISEKTQTDAITGVERTVFYMKGGNINSTYVNEYASVDSENFLFCAAYDKRLNLGVPVIYNRRTKETTQLSGRNMAPFAMVMAKDNTAYFVEGTCVYKYKIGESVQKELLFEEPDSCLLSEVPTITNDGKYLTVFCAKDSVVAGAPNTIYRIDTATGDYKILVDKEWTDANIDQSINPFIGHVIINPADPDVVNFMHGGGDNVKDRLWLYDNGVKYQPYIQKLKENGSPGEHITHAFFSLDGKRLYFLRPPASSSVVESGITYVNVGEEDAQATVLNGDYSYIHTSVDEGDKHFISDTQIVFDEGMYKNEIVLYSDVAKETMLLAYVPVWKNHPCQSHTTFTGDGKGVVFNIADETSHNSQVAYINVEEIIDKLDKGEYNKHNKIAFADHSVENGMNLISENGIKNAYVAGKNCIELNLGAGLPIEVYGTFVKAEDKGVNIYITYYNNSSADIKILYNTDSEDETDAVKNKKEITIKKTNSNQWVTKKIRLEDASFRSANADSSDIIVNSTEDSLYISQIAVFSGEDEKISFSSYTEKEGTIYIPVVNPSLLEKNLLLITKNEDVYGVNTAEIKGEQLAILTVSAEFDRLFVLDDVLCPLNER